MSRCALVVALLALARVAYADPDYAIGSRQWNGLASLADEARQAACELHAESELDWSALDAHDAVWFVYPRRPVDAAALTRFLQAGGRALVADDFGAAEAVLAQLGIRRFSGALPEAEHFAGNPALPIARVRLQTELSQGVPALVANHPAFFSSSVPPTYAFPKGAALVIEGRLRKGYFVALADPSVLINNMLEIDDNRAFARALVRRTCRPGDRLHLLTQSFVTRGEPVGELGAANNDSASFAAFNRMLVGIDEAVPVALSPRLMVWLALLLAVVAVVAGLRAWPSVARIEGDWARAPAAPATGWQAQVDRYAATVVPPGYGLPATMVRQEVMARLSEALGGVAVADWPAATVRARVTQAAGGTAGRDAAELWTLMGRIQRRAPLGGNAWVRRRQLDRLYHLATRLFDALAQAGQGRDSA